VLDAGERFSLLLRLHHARRSTIEKQQVVGTAVWSLHHELPNRHPARGREVDGFGVLHGHPEASSISSICIRARPSGGTYQDRPETEVISTSSPLLSE